MHDANGRPTLIADLSIRGVWQPQTVALLDVRVIDTNAQSYASHTVDAVLCSAEQEKKNGSTQQLLKKDVLHLLLL